ncbi:MAG: DinB family protein [Chitinophagales bacterium]
MKEALWKQFGAAIDMMENALSECPEPLWNNGSNFWHIAYHTIFYLDYYLDTDPDRFAPPAPFTLSEFEDGEMPPKVYSKEELIGYVRHCREKCYRLIMDLDAAKMELRWKNPYRDYNRFEILIYNMRHVQHHTAQLNMLMRQGFNHAPNWVSRTRYGG